MTSSKTVSSAGEVKMTGPVSAPGVQSRGGGTRTKRVAAVCSLGSAVYRCAGASREHGAGVGPREYCL